jgi:hypothetical protein
MRAISDERTEEASFRPSELGIQTKTLTNPQFLPIHDSYQLDDLI